MTVIIVLLLIWAICGFVNYGVWVGTNVKVYLYKPTSKLQRAIMAFGGIPSAIVLCIWLLEYNIIKQVEWRLRPLTVEQRWAVFQKKHPDYAQYKILPNDFNSFKEQYQ